MSRSVAERVLGARSRDLISTAQRALVAGASCSMQPHHRLRGFHFPAVSSFGFGVVKAAADDLAGAELKLDVHRSVVWLDVDLHHIARRSGWLAELDRFHGVSTFELGRDQFPCRVVREVGRERSRRVSNFSRSPVNWPAAVELGNARTTPPREHDQFRVVSPDRCSCERLLRQIRGERTKANHMSSSVCRSRGWRLGMLRTPWSHGDEWMPAHRGPCGTM